MFKQILAAVASISLLVLPSLAFAQDDVPVQDEAPVEAEAEAPAPARSYPRVNFDETEDLDNVWLLDLSNGQRVAIRLMPQWAPEHVARVKELTRQGFYNGVVFHRVIEGFMAQGGDPTGTGQGGSQLPDLKAEFNPMPHIRGTVSMARAASDDSANSQFFIVFYPRFSLDKKYTNFGRVIDNMSAVDSITRGEPPANPTRILQASIAADGRGRPAPPAPPQAEEEITLDALNAPLN